MAVDILVALLSILFFLCLGRWYRDRNNMVTNWPVVGMLPSLIVNTDRAYDFFTELLNFYGGTFVFKGPLWPNMDCVFTSNPNNVNHMLCRNHENYEKGSEFREIFEPFGAGLVTSDSEVWKSQRRVLAAFTKNNKAYHQYLDQIFRQKVEKGLMPVLEYLVKHGAEVDLENLLQRFDYDHICLLALGFDPNSLTTEFPDIPSKIAFDQVEQSLFYRNIVPIFVWKIQQWLQIGEEKKLMKSMKIADDFVYSCISSRRESLKNKTREEALGDQFDVLTAFIAEDEGTEMGDFGKSDKFLRDTAYSLVTAGKETVSVGLTWFFWLILTHRDVEKKILEEIKVNAPPTDDDDNLVNPTAKELSKYVYLQATLCETLRLYPPFPINNRCSIQPDVLPSGDHINPNTRFMIVMYAMGRKADLWGDDCLEFKPERWLSERGELAHKPSYTFVPFGAGPRVCLGKDLSFKLMKILAINMLRNYKVELVENQTVGVSSKAIALHTLNGLKVRVKKRLCI